MPSINLFERVAWPPAELARVHAARRGRAAACARRPPLALPGGIVRAPAAAATAVRGGHAAAATALGDAVAGGRATR